jgi:histone deacetylase 6
MNDISSRTDEGPQATSIVGGGGGGGLQSSPLPNTAYTSKRFEPGGRPENALNALKSPKMPAVGLFGVSPKTSGTRSPLKRRPS